LKGLKIEVVATPAADEHGFSPIGENNLETRKSEFVESVFICVDLWLGFMPSHDHSIPQDG
jgi:hypothetical protein